MKLGVYISCLPVRFWLGWDAIKAYGHNAKNGSNSFVFYCPFIVHFHQSQQGTHLAHSPSMKAPSSSELVAHHGTLESNLVHSLWRTSLYLKGNTHFSPLSVQAREPVMQMDDWLFVTCAFEVRVWGKLFRFLSINFVLHLSGYRWNYQDSLILQIERLWQSRPERLLLQIRFYGAASGFFYKST